MSYASNLGFSKHPMNNNVNDQYVNKNNYHTRFSELIGGKSKKLSLVKYIKQFMKKYKKSRKYKLSRKSRKSKKYRKSRKYRHHGGYHQFMSNVPYTPSYSVGGPLSPKDSALANPPPIKLLNNCNFQK